PYYQLLRAEEGVGSGFRYEIALHITLGSLTGEEPSTPETLYDRPLVDSATTRVSGPFTVEAVPAPVVKPFEDMEELERSQDNSIVRSGETQRQSDWRDELLKSGIRGKGGQQIEFARVEPLPGTRWLHADAETKEAQPQRGVVSFGPQ